MQLRFLKLWTVLTYAFKGISIFVCGLSCCLRILVLKTSLESIHLGELVIIFFLFIKLLWNVSKELKWASTMLVFKSIWKENPHRIISD